MPWCPLQSLMLGCGPGGSRALHWGKTELPALGQVLGKVVGHLPRPKSHQSVSAALNPGMLSVGECVLQNGIGLWERLG